MVKFKRGMVIVPRWRLRRFHPVVA